MIANGGSQDRYPEETRRDLFQYRNGNASREDLGDEIVRRDTRRDNSVINNAVLNHLAGLHRRPVNRVRLKEICLKLLVLNVVSISELEPFISCFVSCQRT